ncbi:hypothetical protein Dsui_2569 [Azospira oryzae PS]|uniref:NYN domain-containing protein n=1 Tax=Azospira oryzae (strain ATCC BAA-33 / DSM 13638 / PS) TaxID=640081 RepID=G8QN80_AZOOP|nr:NYN domain-containing protein [Azospira oryzae]AEV26920.1 hypothetical protein Dsui_2569 [Azospira oryzae PS]
MKTIVFVDYWNLQATLQFEDGRDQGHSGAALRAHRFNIDWFGLGPKLTALAEANASPLGNPLSLSYQETRIYSSADPTDAKFKGWVNNSLGRQPGIRVACVDRKPKRNPCCAHCHREMDICPHCQTPIQATQEKGVDTHLVTDLLCLGLDGSYDVALLVSQDSDMAPAAAFLGTKGIKVIQVGIRHFGRGLAAKCWADFDLYPLRTSIQRV